jgi:hypothetical protein
MKRLVAVTCVAVAAGCGGSGQETFDASQVEQVFRDQGIVLQRSTSNGAEQTAMGETSPCATYFVSGARFRMMSVWVCDDVRSARASFPNARKLGFRWERGNVVVDYRGPSAALQSQIERALAGLD